MNFFEVFWIAVGLSMDAFAVSIACSVLLCHVSFRHIFRLGFHFGLFQAVMPVIGWFAGRSVSGYISAWDHWVAFGLLSAIGLKAVKEAFSDDGEQNIKGDPTRGLSLILLSVATSIDALAVGVSLAAVNVNIFQPALLIGVITAAFSVVGTVYGCRIGARFGKKVEAAGGIILILIGVKILLEHLLS
ncbi:MAG: manganese efflux pump MntP family protein [Geovibrio sp.]|nr:manganese efflux pump MntP family protein [Geovibrio sp.]